MSELGGSGRLPQELGAAPAFGPGSCAGDWAGVSPRPSGTARLLFVGDISLAGDYAQRSAHEQPDWVAPFVEVRAVFGHADLRIGNLEAPLHLGPTARNKRNILGSPAGSAEALSYLGFSVLGMANNHIADQGTEGVAATRELLAARGIGAFGAGCNLATAAAPAFATAKGLLFGFLGYAETGGDVNAEEAMESREGSVPLSLERIGRDIAAARSRSAHIVVSLHWGYQHDRFPSPEQITVARKAIDMGALVVFGHHPHVLQGIERYQHGLILYSMGNFFLPDFRRTDGLTLRFPRESRQTAAVICDVGPRGVESYSVVPLLDVAGDRIRVLTGRSAERAATSIAGLSAALERPDYSSFWQSHHRRTVRKRCREESGLRIRGEFASILRRTRTKPLRNSLRDVRPRHLVELLKLCRRMLGQLAP